MYKKSIVFDSSALAAEQLEVAIEVFLAKRSFAAAVTLAGAAEELFGVECRDRGLVPFTDWMYENTEPLFQHFYGSKNTKKRFVADQNAVRNALKHLNARDAIRKQVELEESACWMIVRADYNAELLDYAINGRNEFNDWFLTNVVGNDYA